MSKIINVYKGGTPIEKCFSFLGFFLMLMFFPGMHNSFWNILIFWGAYFLIIHILLGRPCPSCKAWRAGEIKSRNGNEIFLKCKHCSHEWIIEEIVDQMAGGG